jgi:hypothetical protein
MIQNKDLIERFSSSWTSLKYIQRQLSVQYLIPGSGVIGQNSPDETYNLPLILAFSLLDEVLSEFISQGKFKCGSWKLGTKMETSKDVISWIDYQAIFDAKEARNGIAHRSELVTKQLCIKYINEIEAELSAWGVICT